jgi:hypothetical protein
MLAVIKDGERIGSLLKIMAVSRPWYAYAADGRSENFKTRKEAAAWVANQYDKRLIHTPRGLRQ